MPCVFIYNCVIVSNGLLGKYKHIMLGLQYYVFNDMHVNLVLKALKQCDIEFVQDRQNEEHTKCGLYKVQEDT